MLNTLFCIFSLVIRSKECAQLKNLLFLAGDNLTILIIFWEIYFFIPIDWEFNYDLNEVYHSLI